MSSPNFIRADDFEIVGDGSNRHLGACEFLFLPTRGDKIEIVPVLGPPFSWEVKYVEHRVVHESQRETKVGRDSIPRVVVYVANPVLISELL